MNTVGPYHNRQETYGYFSLPFCAGPKESISHYHETLGEALQGTELEFSGLQIEFNADIARTEYCQVQLNEEKQKAFLYAVKNHYWYQMYLDDLPIWGIVGEIDEKGWVGQGAPKNVPLLGTKKVRHFVFRNYKSVMLGLQLWLQGVLMRAPCCRSFKSNICLVSEYEVPNFIPVVL